MQRYYQPTLTDLSPPPMPLLPEGRRPRWVAASMPPLLLVLILALPAYGCIRDPNYHFPPWDTFVLLFLWAWCGYRLLTRPISDASRKCWSDKRFSEASLTDKLAELGADVGGTHERLADQHGPDAGRL